MSPVKGTLRVLGLMSGTSADGIDVALARISGAPPRIHADLEHHASIPFRKGVREAIMGLAEGRPTTTAEISGLNLLLGEEFARAAIAACREFRVPLSKIDLIGSHGQTVFHQGPENSAIGRRNRSQLARLKIRRMVPPTSREFASLLARCCKQHRALEAGPSPSGTLQSGSTLQIGEPAVIAARAGVTTIGDFRVADMAAGGQGAPLVPFVDYLLYRDPLRGRVALNIGGIANLTAIPPAARSDQVFALDTGPGNMVIDALVRHFTHRRQSFDRDARIARRGHVLPALLNELMRDPYFARRPPKTCGREQYGEAYVARILAWGRKHRARPEDLVRTATILTPLSIVDALHRFVPSRNTIHDLIVAGGGARNPLIMAQLAAALPGVQVHTADDFGVPSDAKEAFAFAILAYETFHRRPSNLPSATGARRPAILGKICFPPAC